MSVLVESGHYGFLAGMTENPLIRMEVKEHGSTPIVDEMLTPKRERVPLYAGDVRGRCRCGKKISENKRFCQACGQAEAAAMGLLR